MIDRERLELRPPEDPVFTGVDPAKPGADHTYYVWRDADGKFNVLPRFREQRRQRRWGCLLVVALTALVWLSLYVAVRALAAPSAAPRSPDTSPDQGVVRSAQGQRGASHVRGALHSGNGMQWASSSEAAALLSPVPGGAPPPPGTFPPALAGGATTDVLWTGIVNYATPSLGRWYLAIPAGPGVRVRICGPSGCLDRISTDAGPSLERQRAGRIADLNWIDWQAISGVPLRYGGFPGSVLVLKRPAIPLPQTDRGD